MSQPNPDPSPARKPKGPMDDDLRFELEIDPVMYPTKRGKPEKSITRYIEGFLAGQAVAYCERVNTGGGTAAQLVCPNRYVETLTRLIEAEGCKLLVEQHESGRSSLWIYRDTVAKRIIVALQSISEPTELGIWSMGKLFGYSDQDVLSFIKLPGVGKSGNPPALGAGDRRFKSVHPDQTSLGERLRKISDKAVASGVKRLSATQTNKAVRRSR